MHNCRVCQQVFNPTAYQDRKSDWRCLPCRRLAEVAWRKQRAKMGKPVVSTKMPSEWHKEYERGYFKDPQNRQRRAKLMQKYRNDPKLKFKHIARWAVNRAVKTGILTKQPCEQCGEVKVQAHHPDYSQPLKIKWLCIACHRLEHTKAEGKGLRP